MRLLLRPIQLALEHTEDKSVVLSIVIYKKPNIQIF